MEYSFLPREEPPPEKLRLQPYPRDRTMQPLRFSLRMLFVGVGLVAAALAICAQWASVGNYLVFLVALVYSIAAWNVKAPEIIAFRTLLWGVVVPALWLAFEPSFLIQQAMSSGSPADHLKDWDLLEWFLLLFCLYQMTGMCVWVFHGGRLPLLEGFLCGSFVLGFLVPLLPGIPLAVFGVVSVATGSIVWAALLTPLFMALAYYQALIISGKQSLAGISDGTFFGCLFLGMAVATAFPVAAGLLVYHLLHPTGG